MRNKLSNVVEDKVYDLMQCDPV